MGIDANPFVGSVDFERNEGDDIAKVTKAFEAMGYDVLECGGMAPFQLTANHQDGHSIYLRSRHGGQSLTVYRGHQSEMDLAQNEEVISRSGGGGLISFEWTSQEVVEAYMILQSKLTPVEGDSK